MAEIRTGKSKIKRISISEPESSFTVPMNIRSILLKNVGNNRMKFRFGADSSDDYFSLKPNEKTPTIEVMGALLILMVTNGPTTIEILMWG